MRRWRRTTPRSMSTPADPDCLALRETHCAGLLLVGDRAYKFKKPVDFGFLDFSTAEKRAHACRREVELNRRFSPDVYLGVADLGLPDGGHEAVVVMCRMPDDRRLATLVRRGSRRARRPAQPRPPARRRSCPLARADVDAEAALPRLQARGPRAHVIVSSAGGRRCSGNASRQGARSTATVT